LRNQVSRHQHNDISLPAEYFRNSDTAGSSNHESPLDRLSTTGWSQQIGNRNQ